MAFLHATAWPREWEHDNGAIRIRPEAGAVDDLLQLTRTVYEGSVIEAAQLSLPWLTTRWLKFNDTNLTPEEQRALLVTLLTVIVNKGCRRMLVRGGVTDLDSARPVTPAQNPGQLYRNAYGTILDSEITAVRSRSKAVLSLLAIRRRGDAAPEEPRFHAVPPGVDVGPLQPGLELLHLNSHFLYSAHLFEWTTTTLLNRSGATLRKLKLSSSPESKITSYQWSTLFRVVILPNLTDFTISIEGGHAPPFPLDDLVHFLGRHPTISALDLQQLNIANQGQWNQLATLTMPALETFTGAILHAPWLLKMLPVRLPRLTTLVFSNTRPQKPPHLPMDEGIGGPYFCDTVLQKLAAAIRSVPGRSEIVLGLNFPYCVYGWELNRHPISEHYKASCAIIRSLRGVRTLRLQFNPNFDYDSEEMRTVVHFVNTCPDVVHLELVDLRSNLSNDPHFYAPRRDMDETVREYLRERCPKLESVQFAWKVGSPFDVCKLEQGELLMVEPGPPLQDFECEPGPPE